MTAPKRKLLKAYLKPEVHRRITEHAKRTNLSASRIVERLLETGRYPDRTVEQAVLNLLAVNADQARLGNLLLKAINETADGNLVRQMQMLLRQVRETQDEIKALVTKLKP